MKKKLDLLLVDFDGVLSNGRFYVSTDPQKKLIADIAIKTIFTTENTELLHNWMKGNVTYAEVHDMVEARSGLDARYLDDLLKESVQCMPMNQPMLDFVAALRRKGVTVSLFTDNMDIFDTVSRYHHKLDNYFDHIYSSSQYGQLKLENNRLIEVACKDSGIELADNVALVDDSSNSFELAKSYGLNTFLYKSYLDSQSEFEAWLYEEYSF